MMDANPFASATVGEHFARGAIGIAAVAAAVMLGGARGGGAVALSLALGVVALIALRGCPICWSIGLAGMLRQRFGGRGDPTSAAVPGPAE